MATKTDDQNLTLKSYVSTIESNQCEQKQDKRSKFLNQIIGESNQSTEEVVLLLNGGTKLHRFRSVNKIFQRNYNLDLDNMRLHYSPSRKRFFCKELPYINVSDMIEIRKGWNTDRFNEVESRIKRNKQLKNWPNINEDQCFSVIINKGNNSIDLVAKNSDVRDLWVKGLSFLIALHLKQYKENQYENWLKRKFRESDQNNNGSLDFGEVSALLNNLNISMNKRKVKHLFNLANFRKNILNAEESLDEEEFYKFYLLLISRPELDQIFKKYSIRNTPIMGPEELLKFLINEQKMSDITLKDCELYIKIYEPEETQVKGFLSIKGFQNLLLSPDFEIFNRTHRVVCQDMSQPLTHYYIASSHNTYLLSNQIYGDSSIEAYRMALLRGCRCVELDVWDGESEPVIYHGHTLTSKIYLRDVIDIIRDYGFRTSSYPIILSIENHCSAEQQKQMAELFVNILGDKLSLKPVSADETCWPSPESLVEKVIIKCKKASPIKVIETDVSSQSNQPETTDADISTHESLQNSAQQKPNSLKNIKVHITQELSDIVNYCVAKKFCSLEECNNNWKFNEMASIMETKSLELADNERKNYIEYNQKHLSRIYPKGLRTDSSNYDPTPHWRIGSQIVALNYQSWDNNLRLNEALFSLNGKCGYVLKPRVLREQTNGSRDLSEMFFNPKQITINIISGQHIPKPEQELDGEVVDPYVRVQVYGHESDRFTYKTSYIKNNGFNPVWNEKCKILIRYTELAFLCFHVKDHNTSGRDETLAQFVIPFQAIMTGYRHIHLLDLQNQPIINSSLFVHVLIEDT